MLSERERESNAPYGIAFCAVSLLFLVFIVLLMFNNIKAELLLLLLLLDDDAILSYVQAYRFGEYYTGSVC